MAELAVLIQDADARLPLGVWETIAELRQQLHLEPELSLRPRPTIADYQHDLAAMRSRPAEDAFGHLRDLLLIGIRVGTISAEDLYSHVRPATIALTVLLDPGAGQSAAELARLIRRDVDRGSRDVENAENAQSTQAWAEAVVGVDAWPGSLRSLLRQQPPDSDGDPSLFSVLRLDKHLWRGANILLALAPPETLSQIVADAVPMRTTGPIVGEPRAVRRARALVRIASHAPLSRPIVDLALMPQDCKRVRIELASNPLTPNVTLGRLLAFADREPGVAAAICLNELASPALRILAYRRLRSPVIRESVREALPRAVAVAFDVEVIAAAIGDQAHLVHALIRDVQPDLSPQARLFVYAHLARMSGLEAVWALELERVGTAERVDPAVRASMASGSLAPLLEAAVADRYRGLADPAVGQVASLRREELLDQPFPWQDPDQPG